MIFRPLLVAALITAAPALALADTQRWSGDGFVVTATTTDQPVAGAAVEVGLVVTAGGGYKVNDEYPIAVEITAPTDVGVAKAKLGRGDATISHDRATFRLALTPKVAGDKRIGLKLKFALCTDTTCEPRKHSVELKLDVK
ncbi:MAG: hypothetical protein IPL61_21820 [Myxococcales bacterium]|nr:hypothetical protein [Myxococcales bacterium]